MQTVFSWIFLILAVSGATQPQNTQRKKRPAPEPKLVVELRKSLEAEQARLAECTAEVEHQKAHFQLQSQVRQASEKAARDWNEFQSQFDGEGSLRPIRVRLVTEPITGAEAYRATAAEVFDARFSTDFRLDSRAAWQLTVGGTNLNASTQAQYVEVELSRPLRLPLASGELSGKFRIASDAAMFTRFSETARVQAVQEMVTRVLTQAVKNGAR